MSSIEFTADDEWWISRTDGDGAQRYPAAINVGGGSVYDTIRYVPERTCRMEYDPVHLDYACTACGEWHDTPTYDARDADDALVYRDYRFCPHCGARVVDER